MNDDICNPSPVKTMEVVLPFKPFTLDEVRDITGCNSMFLDSLVPAHMPLKMGEDHAHTLGLDYIQTFGVFVGWRYLEEGAPASRARNVARGISIANLDQIEREIAQGNTFPTAYVSPAPVAPGCRPITGWLMVPAPPGRLGMVLRLDRLLHEFRARIRRMYPNG